MLYQPFSLRTAKVYLGSGVAGGDWHRVERDLAEIVPRLTPGVTLTNIDYVQFGLAIRHHEFWIDDIRLSNSITVEKNVLAGGSIGHIVRNRTINPSTYAATDRWFHYDQVGSVMSVSNNSGNLETTYHQDAFGNVLASWQSGQWASDSASAGWHHNTKELDGDIGLVYMFQRWYLPEVGVFVNATEYDSYREHPYSYAASAPTNTIDPDGRRVVIMPLTGDGSDKEQIIRYITTLMNCGGEMNAMIDALIDSDHTAILYNMGRGGGGSGGYPTNPGRGISMRYDRDQRRELGLPPLTPGTGSDTVSWLGDDCPNKDESYRIAILAHELRHALNAMQGIAAWDPISEQESAIEAENQARKCLGLPERLSYGSGNQPGDICY